MSFNNNEDRNLRPSAAIQYVSLSPTSTVMSDAITRYYSDLADKILISFNLDFEKHPVEQVNSIKTSVISRVLGLNLPPSSVELMLKKELETEFKKRSKGKSQLDEQNTVKYAKRINTLKEFLKESPDLKSILKSLIDEVVRLEVLPEYVVTFMYPEGVSFNGEKIDSHELISLLTITILWTLQESGEFSPLEASIVYHRLFLRKTTSEINTYFGIEDSEEQYMVLSNRISSGIENFSENAILVYKADSNLNILGANHPIYSTIEGVPLNTPNRIRNLIISKTIEIPEGDPIKKTTEYMLLSRLRHGDLLARNKFTVSLTRLAGFMAYGSYARKMIEIHELPSTASEDFLQDCLEFVLSKSHKFDPVQFNNSGLSFFVNNFKTIIQRSSFKLSNNLSAADHINVLCSQIRPMLNNGIDTETIFAELSKSGVKRKRFELALAYLKGVISLDATLNEDGLTLYDLKVTASTDKPNVDENVNRLLHELGTSSFGAYVLYLRTTENMTLQEVGDRFGITRERVRQIQEQYFERISGRKIVGKKNILVLNRGSLVEIVDQQLQNTEFREIFLKKTGLFEGYNGKVFNTDNTTIFANLPINEYNQSVSKQREELILNLLKLSGVIGTTDDKEAIEKFKKAMEELL